MAYEIIPDNNDSHTSRADIFLSTSINHAILADINWLAAEVATHISDKDTIANVGGSLEFNTLDGFVVAVVYIPGIRLSKKSGSAFLNSFTEAGLKQKIVFYYKQRTWHQR